jgi:hypothetical protein
VLGRKNYKKLVKAITGKDSSPLNEVEPLSDSVGTR